MNFILDGSIEWSNHRRQYNGLSSHRSSCPLPHSPMMASLTTPVNNDTHRALLRALIYSANLSFQFQPLPLCLLLRLFLSSILFHSPVLVNFRHVVSRIEASGLSPLTQLLFSASHFMPFVCLCSVIRYSSKCKSQNAYMVDDVNNSTINQ